MCYPLLNNDNIKQIRIKTITDFFFMKILIIGFGSIGKCHVNNLIQNTDCETIICSKRKKWRMIKI
jgi:lactate dehydrogenase-like 2-hydroxyacid dehydrogenase